MQGNLAKRIEDMDEVRTNILGLTPEQLVDYCSSLGEKPFRARQLQRWIHQSGVSDFNAMTDLAKSLRSKLVDKAEIRAPVVLKDHISADGTRKWLLDVGQGNAIETVFIPEDDRGTLCVSTQAGCAVNCLFCSTGKQGFNRNLTAHEIIGQLWLAEAAVRKSRNVPPGKNDRQISNVVMMGMGEPLHNFEATVSALKLMLDDNAYGLSRRRVTVSTCGVVPMIDRLAQECPVALAVSLHAPNDRLRDVLVVREVNGIEPDCGETLGVLDAYDLATARPRLKFVVCFHRIHRKKHLSCSSLLRTCPTWTSAVAHRLGIGGRRSCSTIP